MAVETAYIDSAVPGFTGRAELVKAISVDSTGTAATALPARTDVTPNAIPVYASNKSGVDRSLTATTTAAVLMAAMTTRGKFFIKNDSTIDVWINVGGTAVATAGGGNMKVAANGGYYELAGCSAAISIIAASATAAITAREL